MPLAASLVEDHRRLLRLNRNRIIVFRLKADRHRRTAGVLEAARRMQSSSQSAWMRTKAICKFADGIYNNWYVFVCYPLWQRLIGVSITEGVPVCCC